MMPCVQAYWDNRRTGLHFEVLACRRVLAFIVYQATPGHGIQGWCTRLAAAERAAQDHWVHLQYVLAVIQRKQSRNKRNRNTPMVLCHRLTRQGARVPTFWKRGRKP